MGDAAPLCFGHQGQGFVGLAVSAEGFGRVA